MADSYVSQQAMLEHWQGHQRLTRRVIEAFPDEHFNGYSVGGMRPFGGLVMEMLGMAVPTVRGVVTGTWDNVPRDTVEKSRALELWDESSAELARLWPQIPGSKFCETITAYETFTGPAWSLIQYAIDNEIHHRGQGYVYLRSLGITPPAFYERGITG